MIDRQALLATLKPLVSELETSIRARALDTPDVAEHLEREHERAVVAERTAMSLEEWRDGEITQAAVAWVLGCVFVRFLEDNRLIDQALISGPGGRRAAALGHREEHFRVHPAHSDREYFEACFREVARYPAVAPLFDERHNPLWRLVPTADGARDLRDTFTAIDPETGLLVHDFTDPEFGTRFLGDLYQDLSEAAKKRYALLQTPGFVERFILDRTLDPAINEFGLNEARLIDPTCGSGHFLIGAFERFFALWQAREPATTATVLAQRCLDHVAGVDLNPYATAIARFRLIIAALRRCGVNRLAAAPAFRLHLATGDSLLHGPLPSDGATMLFDANRLSQNVAHVYGTEDATELKEILGRGYHAVVGNPPYIAVQDAALRDAYRSRYASCHAKYVLTVPFMERFFELAQVRGEDEQSRAGFVGKITGNNFMKREFGGPLVERFLPSVDVTALIDTSGASIPGHGTPTVILFGRSRSPIAATIRVVDKVRGEPGTPADAAKGKVWTAILEAVDTPGVTNAFVRCIDVARRELLQHPLSLGIGRDLRRALEHSGARLSSRTESIGVVFFTLEDDAFIATAAVMCRKGVEMWRPVIEGDLVRDWRADTSSAVVFPYAREDGQLKPLEELRDTGWYRYLWPGKSVIANNIMFGRKTKVDSGLRWYEFGRLTKSKLDTNTAIVSALVESHPHFAFDRDGSLAKHSAIVVKLGAEMSAADHFALLECLNTSVIAFFLQEICHNKGSGGGSSKNERWTDFFEFNGSNLGDIPIPPRISGELSERLDKSARDRASLLSNLDAVDDVPLTRILQLRSSQDRELSGRMISLQEELDWKGLIAYGLAPDDLRVLGADAPQISLGHRAFEIVLARQVAAGEIETTWFERHGSTPVADIPRDWPPEYRSAVEQRVALIESEADVALVERPEHKRRWSGASWDDRQRDALTEMVLDALEEPSLWEDLRLRSTNELTDKLRSQARHLEALEMLAERKDADLAATLQRLIMDAAVPNLAAERLTDKGLGKRKVWERVWGLQRAQDEGQEVGRIPTPPKYTPGDFRRPVYWKHRSKLDVPNERFVLIPKAERGADSSSVVGWGGWNERDLARALAGRVTELRQEHAADADRLVPLLAGVLELLPWIHQWHWESDALFGGPPGAFFESWLDGELAALGVTRDTLRAWRPLAPTRGRKAKASTA